MTEDERTDRGRRLAADLRRAAALAERGEIGEIAAEPTLRPPAEPRGFADGVSAERHLRENVCPNGVSLYGPYVPPPERGVSLHEKDDLVRFPPHLQTLFRAITPQMARVLVAMLTRAVERQTVGVWWRRTVKAGIALVVAMFAAAKWGADQIPVVREIVAFIRGIL